MDELFSKRRELFYNNLVLLDLDARSFEKEYNTSYHKDMFAAPNKKGFEIVTHFLFSKLSSATRVDYKLPWPLVTKECDRSFQKICFDHLNKFAQENVIRFPRIVPSILSTFGGERFYEVYFAFSTYVLAKTMEGKGIELQSRPVVKRETYKVAEEVLQLAIILAGRRFRDVQMVTQANHEIWTKTANDFMECLKNLKDCMKNNEELLNKTMVELLSWTGAPSEQKVSFKQVIDKVYEYNKPAERKKLEKLFQKETKLWEMLASTLSEDEENFILDGRQFNICVAEDLPEEFKPEFQKIDFKTSEVDGKLCVTRFVKLFEIYLKLATQVFMKGELGNLHANCSAEDVSNIQGSLKSVTQLINKLSEIDIPEMNSSIKSLKSTINFDDLSILDHELYIPLPNLNFNPEAVKERIGHFEPGESFKFSSTDLKREPTDEVFTEHLSDSNASMDSNPHHLKNERLSTKDIFQESVTGRISQISLENEVQSPMFGTSLLQLSWLEDECLFSISNPNISLDD